MQQGWIEWAKVCKLTILHDLATFTWGSDHNYVLCGHCYDKGSLFYFLCSFRILSKPCLSLSFAFVQKAKCLLLLLPPPCHDQDHLHTAWGWDETPLPSLSLCPYLTYSLDDMIFFPPEKFLFHIVFFCHLSCLFLIYFNLRWFALCERSVCLRIFPPIECYQMTVADF